jgi:hypothetical protein
MIYIDLNKKMITMSSNKIQNIEFNVYPVNVVRNVRHHIYDSATNHHMISKRSVDGDKKFFYDYITPETNFAQNVDSTEHRNTKLL